MNRRYLIIPFIGMLIACAPEDSAWNSLHPQTTKDCTRWLDGSYFPIGSDELGTNSVGASRPETDKGEPILRFVYSVAAGATLKLDSTRFSAVTPSGSPIAVGRVSLLLNPNVKGEVPRYGEIPLELHGGSAADRQTLYHVVVQFHEQLPSRFDIVLPDVWINGTKYPVRIFGYNVFSEKGTLGLCN